MFMLNDICSLRSEIAKSQPSETGSTERVGKLNAMLLAKRPRLCLHRARAYTRVFSQTEGEPIEMRFAKAYARTLKDMPAVIAEGELLVGSPTCRIRNGVFVPEVQSAWFRKEIDTISNRAWDPFEVTPQQVEEVKEMLDYWEGRTLFDLWQKACPPKIASKVTGKGWADSVMGLYTNGFHFTPAWEEILHHGIIWYETRVKEALAKIDHANPESMGRHHFYDALLIIIEAVKEFAENYSQKALQLAQQEADLKRKEELTTISRITARVPYFGARSFHEALQSVCFIMALFHLEGTGPVYTPGRIDQFLNPFFKADLEKGVLTREQAQELLELLCIKLTGNLMIYTSESARSAPGYRQVQTISLGGLDANGKDASNELSYIFLEAAKSVRTILPDIAILWHLRETPYELKMKAAELIALGLGMPKICNTEVLKTQLMNAGFSAEEASLGWIQGCTEPYGPGCKQYGHSADAMVNLPLALEAVLFNGRKRMPNQPGSGEVLGLETGDPSQFEIFDEFSDAVKKQIALQLRDGHIASSWAEWIQARHFPVLLQSLFTDACIDRGLPANAGGARINVGPGIVPSGGLATLADSLAAVKKLVYEDKQINMTELIRAIEADFEGYETVREMLIHKVPKFGNDVDDVDDIARDIWRFVNTETQKYITPLGNRNVASTCFPVSNIMEGARTWATPDGRKAGMPFSNHVGPTDGMDINGPIGNINSVTKLDMSRHWGVIHNLYFVNVDSEEAIHRMIDLIDLFVSRGGYHVQINCQDKEVFIDAQKHPERHRGLMVRVAGYVAYFVELPRELQDQIIGRTSHYA